MNGLGSKIAGKRKDLGLTQQEFADMLSVTRQTVSRWEAGTVFPDIATFETVGEEKLIRMSSVSGVSLAESE